MGLFCVFDGHGGKEAALDAKVISLNSPLHWGQFLMRERHNKGVFADVPLLSVVVLLLFKFQFFSSSSQISEDSPPKFICNLIYVLALCKEFFCIIMFFFHFSYILFFFSY